MCVCLCSFFGSLVAIVPHLTRDFSDFSLITRLMGFLKECSPLTSRKISDAIICDSQWEAPRRIHRCLWNKCYFEYVNIFIVIIHFLIWNHQPYIELYDSRNTPLHYNHRFWHYVVFGTRKHIDKFRRQLSLTDL